MHPPTGTLDIDDYRMMHHAIYDSSSDNRVSKVIANVLEVNVGSDQGGTFAVTSVDNLEEQRGVPCVLLLQSVEAYLIDQEDVGQGILYCLSFLWKL